MSETYIPLYRKYRPQIFVDVVGQKHIVKALENAITLNKISHAYLLCGPRGTGKTSIARIFAKSLNCINGPTVKPCLNCPSCLDVINNSSIDVIEIDAASNRLVEDTQAILEKIQYAPVNGKFKIFVIDEVHMLSNHAFNALLKTLEEPPKNVIFILATTEAHKVLETIVSRCQRYDFQRIQTNDIVERLKYIANRENIKIDSNALMAIAKNSVGGMRDSLSLLDQLSILGNSGKIIDENSVNSILGKISNDTLFEFSKCILEYDHLGLLTLLHKQYDLGNEPLEILNNLIEYYKNLLIIKNCNDNFTIKALTFIDDNLLDKFKNQSSKLENEKIVYIIEKLSKYLYDIRNSTDRYLWLEICLLDLLSVNFNKISDLVEKINELEAKISNGVKIDNNSNNATNINIKPVKLCVNNNDNSEETIEEKNTNTSKNNTEIKSEFSSNKYNWSDLLKNIESMPSRAFYSNLATPISLSPEKIVISFRKEIFVNQARDVNKSESFIQACKKYFNVDSITVDVKLKTDIINENIKKNELKKELKKEISPKPNEIEPEIKIEKEVFEKKSDKQLEKNNDYSEKPNIRNENNDSNEILLSDDARWVLELFNGKIIDK